MKLSLFTLLLVLLVAVSIQASDSTKAVIEETRADTLTTDSASHFVVYYFYTNKRCPTCLRLEAYSKEALDSSFAEQLKDSTVLWSPVNTDEAEQAHFVKDYDLYTKTLIVSQVAGGKQIRWKNLDKIWELVGDKEKFLAYVQAELKSFMSGT